MPKILNPKDRNDWLAMRREDVTSTESAALFGLSPYVTTFELYHRKIGAISDEIEQNERMTWGLRLQDAIASGLAEERSLNIRRINTYWRHDEEPRMGSSFDFEIVTNPKGPGLLEIKNVDYIQWRDNWQDDEAPPHIEVQLQHQLEVANRNWGIIVALVGGNTLKVIEVERDREMGAGIRSAIAKFWADFDANREPKPDFNDDADAIKTLYKDASGQPYIAKGNNHLNHLAREYAAAREQEKAAALKKEAAKAEMLTLIGNAPKVLGDGWSVSCGTINRKEAIVKATSFRGFTLTMKETA